RDSVWPCEARPTSSAKISGSLLQIFRRETLAQRVTRLRNKRRVWKRPDQPDEQPMSMHRRMPVVTAAECGRELAWRGDIGIAVENMTDFVRILFLNARQR